MPNKPIELPPEVAFVRDMRAFHAEQRPIKRDEIASPQIHVLRKFQGSDNGKLRLRISRNKSS